MFNFSFLDTVSGQTIFFIPMELIRVTCTQIPIIYTVSFSKKAMFKENEPFGFQCVILISLDLEIG